MKSVEAIMPPGSEGSEGSGLPLYSSSIFPFCFCGSDKKRKKKEKGSTIENHFLHFLHFPSHGYRRHHRSPLAALAATIRSSAARNGHLVIGRDIDIVGLRPGHSAAPSRATAAKKFPHWAPEQLPFAKTAAPVNLRRLPRHGAIANVSAAGCRCRRSVAVAPVMGIKMKRNNSVAQPERVPVVVGLGRVAPARARHH
jgi:hypothetical protein